MAQFQVKFEHWFLQSYLPLYKTQILKALFSISTLGQLPFTSTLHKIQSHNENIDIKTIASKWFHVAPYSGVTGYEACGCRAAAALTHCPKAGTQHHPSGSVREARRVRNISVHVSGNWATEREEQVPDQTSKQVHIFEQLLERIVFTHNVGRIPISEIMMNNKLK